MVSLLLFIITCELEGFEILTPLKLFSLGNWFFYKYLEIEYVVLEFLEKVIV